MDNFDLKKYLAEGKLLKEDITITGEYEGKPIVSSGDDLEEYLIDIMSQAIGAKDFVRKVEFGMTDETSQLSREDQAKLIQFYGDNIQHFDKMGYNPIGKTDENKLNESEVLNESLELTPEEKRQLIYILEMKLKNYEETGDEFFDEEMEIVANILNKIKGVNEDINYDVFDEKEEIDPEDLTYPLESAMARVNVYDLEDIKSLKQFNDLVKAMEKTGEVPAEFFALKAKEQMEIISQAIMYI